MTIEYKGLKIEVENGDVEINGDTIIFKGKEDKVVHEHHYHYENEQVHYPWWQVPITGTGASPLIPQPPIVTCGNDINNQATCNNLPPIICIN